MYIHVHVGLRISRVAGKRLLPPTKKLNRRQYTCSCILVKHACNRTQRHTVARLISGRPAGLLPFYTRASRLSTLLLAGFKFLEFSESLLFR